MGWFSEVFGGGQKQRKLDFVQLLQSGGSVSTQALGTGAVSPVPASDARTWPLSQPLCHFESADTRGKIIRVPWTYGHSFEGIFVSGATGSGKTSGTGRATARAMLRAGYGGLVLCAKADEPDLWERYAQEEGRAGDVVRFGPGRGLGFNFLDYEISRGGAGGGLAMNAVEVLMQMAEVGGGSKNNEDDTWEKAARHALENAMELCRLAGLSITMARLYEVLTGPTEAYQQLVNQAVGRADATDADREDLTAVRHYFEREWLPMADRQKSGVLMSITAVISPFQRGAVRDLFTKATNVTPEDAFAGKIIVVDLPVKAYHEAGRMAAVLWKYLFQRAAERRTSSEQTRPLFLFADEAQLFVTSADAIFQTTARASRVATVYLTQNLPNLYAELGGDGRGKARVDSLLGNLQTKVFHQNACPVTNAWTAETIARVLVRRNGSSTNIGLEYGQAQGGGGRNGNASAGMSYSEQMDFEVSPREFMTLAKGGPEYHHVVTAILFGGGRQFPPANRVWLPIAYNQLRAPKP